MKLVKTVSALVCAAILSISTSTAAYADTVTPVTTSGGSYGVTGDQAFVSQDGRFRLVFQQSDGNFVLYQGQAVLNGKPVGGTPLWATYQLTKNYTYTQGGADIPAYPLDAIFQSDGNLVVYFQYGTNQPFAVWSSDTAGRGKRFVVQNDGNAVIYDASGAAIWSTDTCCH